MTDTKPIIGYKIFSSNWWSLNHKKKYSCPGEFYEDEDLDVKGMHFCVDITDCLYYSIINLRALECGYYAFANVVAPDGAETYNSLLYSTNHLCITSEIPLDSVIELVNPEYFRNMDKFTHYPIYVSGLDEYYNDLYHYFAEKQKLELHFYD